MPGHILYSQKIQIKSLAAIEAGNFSAHTDGIS